MSNNTHVIDREALRREGWLQNRITMTHPHPAAVAAAEKATTLFEQFHGFETSQEVADAITTIISDAITAALSAPSPVGAGDTPRTDEATHHLCGGGEVLSMQRYNHGDWVPADFARQLERELNEYKYVAQSLDNLYVAAQRELTATEALKSLKP